MIGFANLFIGRTVKGYEDFIQGLANCCPLIVHKMIMVTLMPFTEEGRNRLGHPNRYHLPFILVDDKCRIIDGHNRWVAYLQAAYADD